jgi:hypothetical protein
MALSARWSRGVARICAMNTKITLRTSRLLALAATLAAGLLFTGTASAQSFRCKNDLVSVGDARAAVAQKCGEPVARDSFCKPVEIVTTTAPRTDGTAVVRVQSCENVDEWTYNPGYGQFMTTLRFEQGRLTAITYGDRVTSQTR